MFKALMGGGGRNDAISRPSRRKAATDDDNDGRSTTTSSSRRRDSKPSAASTISSSRRSTRGDDRDRILGDVASSQKTYETPSVAGESTASTYVTAEPGYTPLDPVIIERVPRYVDESHRKRTADRKSDRDRDSKRLESRGTKERSSKDKGSDRDRDRGGSRKQRTRTRSGDDIGKFSRVPPTSTPTTAGHFAAEITSPGFNQFPMQQDTTIPGAPSVPYVQFDPHVQQQFPGQFSMETAEPYVPPNPAGEAADYYGDQGQSVAAQPGVRPRPPDLIVGAEPHLLSASPVANPPPEPSSMGGVGAAADYYASGDSFGISPTTSTPSKPSKPGKPSKPSRPSGSSAVATGAVTYGIGSEMLNQTSSSYPMTSGGLPNASSYQTSASMPAQNGSSSHGVGLALGGAVAGAAAGYVMNHHHQQSASNQEHTAYNSYSNGSYDVSHFSQPGGHITNGSGALYATSGHGMQPSPGPLSTYSSGGSGLPQPGSLAFHQQRHGPLRKFIDFWRDPEGVGKFEQYTEAIGVCKYCFEPGSSPQDAPRKHHYSRRRRSPIVDGYGSSTRVDKLSRYASSEDESRRNKSKKSSSWFEGGLAGGLAGFVTKSILNNKDFDDTYNVRSGRPVQSRSSFHDNANLVSSGKSSTSRGVTSRPRYSHPTSSIGTMSMSDSKMSVVRESSKSSHKISRRLSGSRSRSRSRDRRRSSGLKEAALGAAVGSALIATSTTSKSSRRRSRSRSRSAERRRDRKSRSPDRLRIEASHLRRKSSTKGFGNFFTAPSANRRKRHGKKNRGFFSFSNSSSSSADADLAFGSEISGPSVSSRSSKSSRKRSSHDVNAEILGLGIAAQKLARDPYRKNIPPRHLNSHRPQTMLSGPEDDGWEDADSEDSVSSSVMTGLAYGGGELVSSRESVSSSSGLSFWSWGSSSKRQKKDRERRQLLSASQQYIPDGATAHVEDNRDGSSMRMSTSASSNVQPRLVRPGPIPLQQPQPVTPVSQSVYYPTPTTAPIFADSSVSKYTAPDQEPRNGPLRRSNSSPVFPTAPLDMTPTPGILRRGATMKDTATVQFSLTEEQVDREQAADLRERKRQEYRREEGTHLRDEVDEDAWRREKKEMKREEERRLREEAEAEQAARDAAARHERRRREQEDAERRQARAFEESAALAKDAEISRRERVDAIERDARGKSREQDSRSSSWVGPATMTGAIGAVVAASAISSKDTEDSQSHSSKSRHEERREKRRSERRRASEVNEDIDEIEEAHDEEDDHTKMERRIARIAASRIVGDQSPVHEHESYERFFAPDLQHNVDEHSTYSDSAQRSPSIVEAIPTTEKFAREMEPFAARDAERLDLPWPVPQLILTEPTPPQSHSGSVSDVHSPVPPPEPSTGGKPDEDEAHKRERSTTGTHVSWGEHQTHEYEVPTPLSDKDEYVYEQDRDADNVYEHEVPTPPSDKDEYVYEQERHVENISEHDHRHSVSTPVKERTEVDKSVAHREETDETSSHGTMPGGFGDDSEFVATLAAGAAIAGFSPSVVTDDSKYYRRDSPPGSEPEETYRSPYYESVQDFSAVGVKTDARPADEEVEPRHFIEDQEFSAELVAIGKTSIAQEVIEQLNGKKESDEEKRTRRVADIYGYSGDDVRSVAVSVPEGDELKRIQKSKRNSRSEEYQKGEYDESSGSVASAPIGDDWEKSRKSKKSRHSDIDDVDDRERSQSVPPADDTDEKRWRDKKARDAEIFEEPADDARSTAASAPLPGEFEDADEKKRRRRRSKRDSTGRDDPIQEVRPAAAADDFEDADDKKRRRRKSKHDSGSYDDFYDDSRSIAASFSGADELDDYKRLKSKRRSKHEGDPLDDESRSLPEGGDGDYEERRRRRHRSKRDSGAFDDTASIASSPAKIDESREKRRSRDASTSKDKGKDQEKKSGGFFSNIFGSRSVVEVPSTSSDKRDSRNVRSETGADEHESRRRRKKRSSDHRSSSGDGGSSTLDLSSSAGQSLIDLSQFDKSGDREKSQDNGQGEGEGYKSHRQQREERRRHRYEETVESGRNTSEKGREPNADEDYHDQYDDKKQSFLEERPEIPLTTTSTEGLTRDGNDDNGGASGLLPTSAVLAAATGPGIGILTRQREEDQLQQKLQRSRRHSTSPASGEKAVDLPRKSFSRPTSPAAGQDSESQSRRFSMLRMADSPSTTSTTSIPLHFRRPPLSPNAQRRLSTTSTGQSPSSPRTSHRRLNSVEFKNAREFRPLWLVERHSSGKFDVEPEGPLPSLPSSKTTSRCPSVEDLREKNAVETHQPSWQHDEHQVSGRGLSWERKPADLRILTDYTPTDDADILDSQQATPTAETYRLMGPPPIKKDKPKYEFHSPSELLQDPGTYQPELPASLSNLEPLPSIAGSVVSVREAGAEQEETHMTVVAKPELNPSTFPANEEVKESKSSSAGFSSLLTSAEFASIVDAAVSRAVGDDPEVDKRETTSVSDEEVALPINAEELETLSTSREGQHLEPVMEGNKELRHDYEVPSLEPSSKPHNLKPLALGGVAGFGAVVDAAVVAAVRDLVTNKKEGRDVESNEARITLGDDQLPAGSARAETPEGAEEAQVEEQPTEQHLSSTEQTEELFVDAPISQLEEFKEESAPGDNQTAQPTKEATVDDFAPVPSSSKKKKKKDKKKKAQSVDLGTPSTEKRQNVTTGPSKEVGAGASPEAESERPEPSTEESKETETAVTPSTVTIEPTVAPANDENVACIAPELSSSIEEYPVEGHDQADVNVDGVENQNVEKTEVEAVRATDTVLAEAEMRSSPTVEQPEANNAPPHMPAEPEEETWSSTRTKKKNKKDKKKQQSLLSTAATNEELERSEEPPAEQIQLSTTDEAEVSESQTGEILSTVDSANQRELETTKKKKEDEDLIAMTPAQKRKAKKDKKKRQSVATDGETPSESAPASIETAPQPAEKAAEETTIAPDEVPIQKEPHVSATQDESAVSESQPPEETPNEESNESQSTKSKKKAKKDKKKRQSLTWSEGDLTSTQLLSDETLLPQVAATGLDNVQVQRESPAPRMHDDVTVLAPVALDDTSNEKASDELQLTTSEDKQVQPLPGDEKTTPMVVQEFPKSVVPPVDEAHAVSEEVSGGHEEHVPKADELSLEIQDQLSISDPQFSEANPEEEFAPAQSTKKRQSMSLNEEFPSDAEGLIEASAVGKQDASIVQEPAATSIPAQEQISQEESALPQQEEETLKVVEVMTPVEPAIHESEQPANDEWEASSTKSKKKAKKDKKKQQSLGLHEESAVAKPHDSINDPAIEGEAPQKPPPAEEAAVTGQDEQVHEDTVASEAESKNIEVAILTNVEVAISQPEQTEEPPEDPVDDFTPAKAKKKAEKDKKKRQSLLRYEESSVEKTQNSIDASIAEIEPPRAEEAVASVQYEKMLLEEPPTQELEKKQVDEVAPTDAALSQSQQPEEPPQDELEGVSSSKSKKKAKKDKKKRQSVSWTEEPVPETTEDASTDSVVETAPQAETISTTEAAEKTECIPQLLSGSAETALVDESGTVPTEGKKFAVEVEAPPTELPPPEDATAANDFGTPKSKKKAKKDKKQQSLLWDDEPTSEITKDPVDVPADATAVSSSTEEAPLVRDMDPIEPLNEGSSVPETPQTDDTADKDNAESQLPTAVPEEMQLQGLEDKGGELNSAKSKKKAKKDKKKRQSLPWDEEPIATLEKAEGLTDSVSDSTSVAEPSQAPLEEPEGIEHSQEVAAETPIGVQSIEAETEGAPSEFMSTKTKKQAKKDKQKRQSLQLDNDSLTQTAVSTVSVTEEIQEPIMTPERDVDASMTENVVDETKRHEDEEVVDPAPEADMAPLDVEPLKTEFAVTSEPEGTTSVKAEEPTTAEPEEPLSGKAKKKAKKDKKKRQSVDLEEEETTTAATAEPPQEIQEPTENDVSAESVQTSTANDNEGFISAKAKRNAKKDKKRQSVTWEDEVTKAVSEKQTSLAEVSEPVETPTSVDRVEDMASQVRSEKNTLQEPVLQEPDTTTQETPVEADGKETFQSSDKIATDKRENDSDWTDDVVSSQVESQTEESPYPVPFPILAEPPEIHPDVAPLFVPPVEDLEARDAPISKSVPESKSPALEKGAGIVKDGPVTEDISATPFAPPEQAEEEEVSWIAPGKKKVKKKRKSSAFPVGEASIPEEQTAPQAPIASLSEPAVTDETGECQIPFELSDAVMVDSKTVTGSEEHTPANEESWSSAASRRKAKKNKKNQSKHDENEKDVPAEKKIEESAVPSESEPGPEISGSREVQAAAIKDIPNESVVSAEDTPAKTALATDVEPVVEEDFATVSSKKKKKKDKKKRQSLPLPVETSQAEEPSETTAIPVEAAHDETALTQSADQPVVTGVPEPVHEALVESTESAIESNLPPYQAPANEHLTSTEVAAETTKTTKSIPMTTANPPQEDSVKLLSEEAAEEVAEDFGVGPTMSNKEEERAKGGQDNDSEMTVPVIAAKMVEDVKSADVRATTILKPETLHWKPSEEDKKNKGKKYTELEATEEQSSFIAPDTSHIDGPIPAPPIESEPAEASVSLDPFDIPDSVEEQLSELPTESTGVDVDGTVSPQAQQESEDRLRRRDLERGDDLTVAEDLFGDQPTRLSMEGPVSKKLSKKEQKKAKQKTSDINLKQTSPPEPEIASKNLESVNIEPAQQPSDAVHGEPATKSQNDEILLRRNLSKQKKGKKKRVSLLAPEPSEIPEETSQVKMTHPGADEQQFPDDRSLPGLTVTEAEPAKSAQSLSSIEQEKDVTAGDIQQEQSSPHFDAILPELDRGNIVEHEPETPVREFDGNMTAPRAPSSQPEEPSADDFWSTPTSMGKKKKKNRSKKEGQEQDEIQTQVVTDPVEEPQSIPMAEPEPPMSELDRAIMEEETVLPASEQPHLQPEETWTTPSKKAKKGKKSYGALEMEIAAGTTSIAADLLHSRTLVEPSIEYLAGDKTATLDRSEIAESESHPEDYRVASGKKGQKINKPGNPRDNEEKTAESEPEHQAFTPQAPPGQSRIANIFPGLERIAFRRPSPKTVQAEAETKTAALGSVRTHDLTPPDDGLDISVEVDPSYNVSVLSDDGTGTQERAVEIQWQDETTELTKDKRSPPPLTEQTPVRYSGPSPVEATSKDRSSSYLFDSSPSTRVDPTLDIHGRSITPPTRFALPSSGGLHRSSSVHGHHSGRAHGWTLDEDTPSKRPPLVGDDADISPPRTPLDTIREHEGPIPHFALGRESPILPRPGSRSSVGSARSLRRINRNLSGDLRAAAASHAADGDQNDYSLHHKRGDNDLGDKPGSDTKEAGWAAAHSATEPSQPLDHQQTFPPGAHLHPDPDPDLDLDLDLSHIPSSSTYDPVTNKSKRPLQGMSDVYEGWGETPNSPRSPTRPPSVRRRQSMQHLQELEARLDQLISENRLLAAARDEAEQKLSKMGALRRKSDQALNRSDADLRDKEAEIARLMTSLEWMQGEVQRLSQENEALTATHAGLTASHAREVEDLRSQHAQLATGMEDIVREHISTSLMGKDAELRRLRDELAASRQTVQELQQQIVAATADDVLSARDEDYFDNACQRLCQHVQQWVLRFSKHSDLRRCRPLSEVHDQVIADRFDNAMLNGENVDAALADRVRRRDIFMAVVMAMIWEYIFTRYLFGMDREQRQKLKALEKQLTEIGPRRAVAHWRALTLTLLAKRPSFAQQRARDTEAVALEIMATLSQLLLPPASAEAQLLESLRGVLRRAADLAIAMRTQRAEYIMLPPLQPEYDQEGELARQVTFNASLMNERSGAYTSNEALEAQGAIVRLVLFPLVVKKGNDLGDGDEEIVVCPAQVLVARSETDPVHEKHPISMGNRSVSSVVPSVDMGNMI